MAAVAVRVPQRKVNCTPLVASFCVQSTKSGKASSRSAPPSRGDTTTDTGSVAPLRLMPRGMTVNRTVWEIAILPSPGAAQAKASAYSLHVAAEENSWPNVGSPLLPPKARSTVMLDRGAEEGDLDLHGQRSPAVGLVAPAVVGEAQHELERHLDQAEHAELAAHAQVARKRRRKLGARLLAFELEVDAGHDVDAAAGDAEVDRRGHAELEGGLDDLYAGRVELQVEEAAAAEDADRQQERDAAARRR